MTIKTRSGSPVLAAALGLACMTSLAAGCVSGASDPPPAMDDDPPSDAPMPAIDPTGNWDVTYAFAAGCNHPAAMTTSTFTVTRSPNGYAVAAAGAAIAGTLLCGAENCKLSGAFTWAASGSSYQQNANIALDAHDQITGNGTESVTTGMTVCSFSFTVQGTRT